MSYSEALKKGDAMTVREDASGIEVKAEIAKLHKMTGNITLTARKPNQSPASFKEALQQKRDEAVDQLIGEFIEWVTPSLEEAAESGASSLSVSKEECKEEHKILYSDERAELIELRLDGVSVEYNFREEKGMLGLPITYRKLIFKWD